MKTFWPTLAAILVAAAVIGLVLNGISAESKKQALEEKWKQDQKEFYDLIGKPVPGAAPPAATAPEIRRARPVR
jgi:hypothetical protein